MVQAGKAYEAMKDKKDKYQSDLNKNVKANTRLRQEKEDLEKVIVDLNAEIERLNIVEQN